MAQATGKVKARVDELVDELNDYAYRYYVLDAPIIGDTQYDDLYRELETLERDHPELVRGDSPTQRVAAQASAQFVAVEHRQPMLSLANARTIDELVAWQKRNLRMLG